MLDLIILYVTGNTYEYKEFLKKLDFRWDNCQKAWYRNFKSNEYDYIKYLCETLEEGTGMYCEIKGDLPN